MYQRNLTEGEAIRARRLPRLFLYAAYIISEGVNHTPKIINRLRRKMSTRAQVEVIDSNGKRKSDGASVYLYQHCDGYYTPCLVAKAIKKEARWNDAEYLTRIIFDTLLEEHEENEYNQHIGYGIGTSQHGDIEFLTVVDVPAQEVRVYERINWENSIDTEKDTPTVTATFKEFADSYQAQYDKHEADFKAYELRVKRARQADISPIKQENISLN